MWLSFFNSLRAISTVSAWVVVLLTFTGWAGAAPLTGQETAEEFFHAVADRLLRQQFSFGATNIPIAPTNEYSPAVHRLLQIAANIWEGTRTNEFPSVFRPLFADTDQGLIIRGFTNDNRRSTLPAWLAAYRHLDIPPVIGARKGFPNFNEFSQRTVVDVTRKLEFVRLTTNSPPNATNQMYVVGISNALMAEAWNPYSVAYPRQLTVESAVLSTLWITNAQGLDVTLLHTNALFLTQPPGTWNGRKFLVVFNTNQVFMPPSAYRFGTSSFDSSGLNLFESGLGYPLPNWRFSLSNQFLFVLTDGDNILGCVLSRQFNLGMGIVEEMLQFSQVTPVETHQVAALWDTNRVDGASEFHRTWGIQRQIDIASGSTTVDDALWRSYVGNSQYANDKARTIASFRLFLRYGPIGGWGTNAFGLTSLRMQSPFNPTRRLVKTTTWQANDPFVHQLAADLMIIDPNSPERTNALVEFIVPPIMPIPTNLSLVTPFGLNRNYYPWGGNPEREQDPNNPRNADVRNAAIKDPGVRSADDWDFPVGQSLSLSWLGRVHRGTPWQTIYLKPAVADALAWKAQSGDWLQYPTNGPQSLRYFRTHPTNDWALVTTLAPLLNTNAPDHLVSINDLRPSAWAAVWDGLTVLSNNIADENVWGMTTNWVLPFDHLTMTSNSPQTALLTASVSSARTAKPGGKFTRFADFLTINTLSTQSPWLHTSPVQVDYAISDAAIEAIPSQAIQKLREEDIECRLQIEGDWAVELRVPWPDRTYELEVSSNLQHWVSGSSPLVASNGVIRVNLPAAAAGQRFYRGRLVP